MEVWCSLFAVAAMISALVVVRARHPLAADVALGIQGLSLALMFAALSMPLVALMAAVLGVGMLLVRLLTRCENASEGALKETSFALWPLMREGGLLCLILLLWWWLRSPTFVEEIVEVKVSVLTFAMLGFVVWERLAPSASRTWPPLSWP